MEKIDKVTRKKLVYVKRLHIHAQEHMLNGTEFDRMIAVHHFDNAIELLLKSVAITYGISFKNPLRVNFHTLWNTVNEKYEENQGSELPNKTDMFYLHRIRSDVQHLGRTPFSLETIRDLNEYTHEFVQKILNSVFGLKYDELFLSSLVKDSKIRTVLTDVERHFADEKWKETIEKISIAFALAKRKAYRKRYLPTVPKMGDISDEIDILALGLDMEEYKKFIENTPVVFLMDYEKPTFQFQYVKDFDYTRENTLFCFNFALDSILRWRL